MEVKINRFVDLFLSFLIIISLVHIFDEVLPAKVSFYQIAENHKSLSFTEELKINKDLSFSLLVEDTSSLDEDLKVLLVEVDEGTYLRAKVGERAFVYFTPIYKKIRFCIDESHPVLKGKNPLNFRFPLDIIHFIMPILILIMSLIGYKIPHFEFKFPLFLFASVFAIVLQWFLR